MATPADSTLAKDTVRVSHARSSSASSPHLSLLTGAIGGKQ
jgi:hypothetical protein